MPDKMVGLLDDRELLKRIDAAGVHALVASRADGFETIELAASALRRAEKFVAPSIRRKCVIYGGDFVDD